jgi:hypothetical protein
MRKEDKMNNYDFEYAIGSFLLKVAFLVILIYSFRFVLVNL